MDFEAHDAQNPCLVEEGGEINELRLFVHSLANVKVMSKFTVAVQMLLGMRHF